ncbi:MAG: D-alanine--D-alanine ligase, partial [Myxococcota bacterium]
MKTDSNFDPRAHRIGVLMGGLSAEREVSLDTGRGVVAALGELGYPCAAIDWAPDTSLPELLAAHRVEVVWNALHGTYGEDGAVQGLLACLGIRCTGSGILASALAMDKVASKRLFEFHQLATPKWATIAHDDDGEAVLHEWSPPLVIKPAQEGSSVGVTIVRSREQIPAAMAAARAYHGPTLIERYIAGAELQVGILGDAVLGSIEVRPALEFYDYQAKYKRGDTQYLIPAELSGDVVARSEELALAAYRAVGCSGYGRVDMRIETRGDR